MARPGRWQRSARAMALLLGASLLPGCSWAQIKKAPSLDEASGTSAAAPVTSGPCTRAKGLPIADSVIAGGLAATAATFFIVAAAPPQECSFGTCTEPNTGALVGVGVASLVAAAIFTGSALYGYSEVNRCREYTYSQGPCIVGNEPSCARVTALPVAAPQPAPPPPEPAAVVPQPPVAQ
ncbi:MAG TPA: hypothetical protein VFP65_22955 [Anaeromyxobacteraceae bacterium]|nr:hypothetical protein [Anaeromyxobacteraceae bacterium]